MVLIRISVTNTDEFFYVRQPASIDILTIRIILRSTECPNCVKAGNTFTCCAKGGSWFKKCGPNRERTWTEGATACARFNKQQPKTTKASAQNPGYYINMHTHIFFKLTLTSQKVIPSPSWLREIMMRTHPSHSLILLIFFLVSIFLSASGPIVVSGEMW